MEILWTDVDKLGEPEDGQSSSKEPVETKIPEPAEQDMEIDDNLLKDEPELSEKPQAP